MISASSLKRDEQVIGATFKIPFYLMVVERGDGVNVIDVDRREYLDFNAGWSVANTGYGHPLIQQAIRNQLEKARFVSTTTFLCEAAVKLGENLSSIIPRNLEKKVWFGLFGSDAIDPPSKMLPKANGRPKTLSFLGSNGETMGAVSLPGHKAHTCFLLLSNIARIPYAYCCGCPFSLTYPGCGI